MALRSAAICTVRLPSSTITPGQACARRSAFGDHLAPRRQQRREHRGGPLPDRHRRAVPQEE